MIDLIQPISVQQAYMELLTHGGEHHEIGDGGWLMMTMAADSPLRRGESVAIVIINQPPSPIS